MDDAKDPQGHNNAQNVTAQASLGGAAGAAVGVVAATLIGVSSVVSGLLIPLFGTVLGAAITGMVAMNWHRNE